MELDPEVERKLAVDLFNYVWTYLDKTERSSAENDTMLHAAHASRYHWGQVGSQVNFARGEWQISRVYAVLGRSEPALYHAQRCLEICQENNIADFDLAYAYEALARGSAVALQWHAVKQYLELAEQSGQQITEQEDKDLFNKDLKTVPSPPSG